MFNVSVEFIDNGRFNATSENVEFVAEFIDEIVRQEVRDNISPTVLPNFEEEPGAVRRPIHWTSAKQRRFVMRMQKLGLIPVPYVRTHSLSQSWTFTVTTIPEQATIVSLGNSSPHYHFVEGLNQQGFHKDTGWYYAPDRAMGWSGEVMGMIQHSINSWWELIGKSYYSRR